MAAIPDKYLVLVQQKKAFANLATTMPDGSPQVTPVWFDFKNGAIRVNTVKGRVKARNMKEGSSVALAIMDPDEPYRYLQAVARCARSPRAAPTITSIHWRRNISARTNIRFAGRARRG